MSWKERLEAARERLGGTATPSAAAHPRATRWLKRILLTGLSVGIVSFLFWLAVQWVGIIDAIIYSLLFVVGLSLMPFAIALVGKDLPFNGMFGRLHVLLGALAYNHHYLVDLGDKWEWCPGEAERVYIDGQWYDIEGGFDNRSVLGWRPFGILRYKDTETLAAIRADSDALEQRPDAGRAAADGGAVTVEQGGYDEASPPTVSGKGGMWLLDLKRLYSRGVRKIGDTELVETAEEVIERGEVTGSKIEGWRPVIGALMGLALGVLMGWMLFIG